MGTRTRTLRLYLQSHGHASCPACRGRDLGQANQRRSPRGLQGQPHADCCSSTCVIEARVTFTCAWLELLTFAAALMGDVKVQLLYCDVAEIPDASQMFNVPAGIKSFLYRYSVVHNRRPSYTQHWKVIPFFLVGPLLPPSFSPRSFSKQGL